MLSDFDTLHWYAINTKPNQEERVSANLRAGGIETFVPRIRSYKLNRQTGKKISYKKVLFPCYIFARFNSNTCLNKVKFTRGLHSIVSCGEHPCVVEDTIIEIMLKLTGKENIIDPEISLKPGDRVIVDQPYLKDFIGVFVNGVSDSTRVMVLLSTVTYQLNLIVEKEKIRKV
ncbi:MAG: hypothetical protein LUM44_17100 [Pyrinomonadaceae bacterium]|nr:hypothetical protein [Pyrinomonadaceae bacterium]